MGASQNRHAWRPARTAGLLVCILAGLAGCSRVVGPADEAAGGPPRIAVFPAENLSGKPAPDIRLLLVERLKAQGLGVLDDAVLERLVTRHRVRYMGGLEPGFAAALKQEAGVEAVVIPSLEVYDDTAASPRAAVFARLVSTGEAPAVLWVDGKGAAGDDAPGLLGIGIVEDPRKLLASAVDSVARSLARHLAEPGGRGAERAPARKFRPKIVYRSEAFEAKQRYSVAIMPFFNKTARPYAGELMGLHMMRNLMRAENLTIVEPGIVRQELLRFRIIMNDGVSLADTETILNAVNADLVLNGEVLEYRDPLGPSGAPRVDFAVMFIERRTRRILYSSYSNNAGDDGVFFFDWGRVNTAHAMATQMAQAIAERMLAGPSTTEVRRGGR